jgi:hypothetical protein
VRFLLDRVAKEQVFLRALFPLSISFHQCSVLIPSNYMLLLAEGQTDEPGNIPKRNVFFDCLGALDGNVLPQKMSAGRAMAGTVVCLSWWRRVLEPGSVRTAFVVDGWALEPIFLLTTVSIKPLCSVLICSFEATVNRMPSEQPLGTLQQKQCCFGYGGASIKST